MQKTGRSIILLTLTAFLCLVGTNPALALDIYWKPSEKNTGYSQRLYSTTNKVDIQVRVEDAEEVQVNGEEAMQYGDDDSDLWLLDEYILEPGENTISVSVTLDESATDDEDEEDVETSGEITITVFDRPLSGSTRYFEDVGEGITAFDGAVELTLPENAVITRGSRAAWDQGVTVRSSEPLFKLSPKYVPLSPVYTINAPASSYSLSDAGELTLEYDSATGANNGYITVLYAMPNMMYPQAMQRQNSYNLTGDSVTVPFSKTGFGNYLVVRVIQDFQDFYLKQEGKIDLEWARPYIMTLWSRGIMGGLERYPDGRPVPEGFFGLANSSGSSEISITRKEFITMLGKGMRLPVTFSLPHLRTFQDLQGIELEQIQYIEAAMRAGWIPSTAPKDGRLSFRPGDPLTRGQACIIMARALGLQLPTQDRASQQLQAYFPADYQSTYSWNRPHIIAGIQAGLLPLTKKGALQPDKAVTRAEAARMVYKVMKIANKL